MFYSTTFFRDVDGPNKGIPNNKGALWLSWGVGLANFVFSECPCFFKAPLPSSKRCLLPVRR